MKRTPLKRKPHKDPVTPAVRAAVLARDKFECIAPSLGASSNCDGVLTLDHIREHAMMGKRAPSDPAHLVTLCWHHHLDGWATAHRPLLREYLQIVERER